MATTAAVSLDGLRRAIEGRDGKALTALYHDDAVLRIIDRDHPPSHPREIRGRAAIGKMLDDICGRDMSHKFETGIADPGHIAYTESCAYRDGTKVFSSSMIELRDGRIARETQLQAWDG